MKNLLLLILVLAGATFGGKVFVEKKYEDKLNKAIAQTRSFVDIRYDNVKIDVDGSISINGIAITPVGAEESISIEKIKVISSDRLLPIKGDQVFKDGKFPETFELTLFQLSAPIALIDKSQKSIFDSQSKKEECRSFATSFNYSAAGYTRLDSDIRIAFDFSDVFNSVVNFEIFDQTADLTFEWVFDANQIDEVVTLQATQLPISEINATYEINPTAASNFVDQCASVFSITPEVYLEKVVGSAKYSENSFGVDFGPEIRQALVTFMKGGAQFSFKSTPDLQLRKWQQLQFYKSKDILRWLNLELSIDGETLPFEQSVLAAEEREVKKQAEKAAVVKPKYFTASVDDAGDYIDRWVRIKRTNQRKPLEGRLEGYDHDDRLLVEMFRYGGLMTLTVGQDEIEHFEVLSK